MLSKSNPLLVTRSHLFSTALVAMLALQFLSRHRGLPMPQAIFYQLLFKQRLLHVYFGEPVLPTAQSRSHGQVWHCGSFRIVSDHFLARTPFALAFGFGVALKHVSSRPPGTAWKNPKKTLKKIHSSYKWGLPIAVTWAMSITNSNTEDEVSIIFDLKMALRLWSQLLVLEMATITAVYFSSTIFDGIYIWHRTPKFAESLSSHREKLSTLSCHDIHIWSSFAPVA